VSLALSIVEATTQQRYGCVDVDRCELHDGAVCELLRPVEEVDS